MFLSGVQKAIEKEEYPLDFAMESASGNGKCGVLRRHQHRAGRRALVHVVAVRRVA
jgi:hypothetical protein